jgi:hypothetical protein
LTKSELEASSTASLTARDVVNSSKSAVIKESLNSAYMIRIAHSSSVSSLTAAALIAAPAIAVTIAASSRTYISTFSRSWINPYCAIAAAYACCAPIDGYSPS